MSAALFIDYFHNKIYSYGSCCWPLISKESKSTREDVKSEAICVVTSRKVASCDEVLLTFVYILFKDCFDLGW